MSQRQHQLLQQVICCDLCRILKHFKHAITSMANTSMHSRVMVEFVSVIINTEKPTTAVFRPIMPVILKVLILMDFVGQRVKPLKRMEMTLEAGV